MSLVLDDIVVFAAIVVALLAVLEIGYRWGVRTEPGAAANASNQVGAIEGALLGLLGLLLAFSFAAAGSRFLERQDLIVREANTIGTAYLRADLLADPHRSNLRSALKDYTQHRIRATTGTRGTADPSIVAEIAAFHGRMWKAATAGVANNPELALSVLPPVNDVIDIHSLRVSAAEKHIPYAVLGLLLVCSFVSVAVIGYGCGTEKKRRSPITVSMALLIAASLWITYDLDHPRRGLVRLDDAPLQALTFDAP